MTPGPLGSLDGSTQVHTARQSPLCLVACMSACRCRVIRCSSSASLAPCRVPPPVCLLLALPASPPPPIPPGSLHKEQDSRGQCTSLSWFDILPRHFKCLWVCRSGVPSGVHPTLIMCGDPHSPHHCHYHRREGLNLDSVKQDRPCGHFMTMIVVAIRSHLFVIAITSHSIVPRFVVCVAASSSPCLVRD